MAILKRSVLLFLFGAILVLAGLSNKKTIRNQLHVLNWTSIFYNQYPYQSANSANLYQRAIILQKYIVTAKGNCTYSQLYEDVHKKHGYAICQNQDGNVPLSGACSSFLPLTKVRNCEQTMTNWLQKNQRSQKPSVPPNYISADFLPQYSMYGHAFLRSWYRRDSHNNPNIKPILWTIAAVNGFMKAALAEKWRKFPYRNESENMVTALKTFPAHGNGLVIGSLMPWLESILLLHGAKTVLTAEYHPINSTHPKLLTLHPLEMAKTFKKYVNKFDFAASFSSIEHSGLGRYGDNLDATGDLLELEKIRCFLKVDAKFYLSLPIGIDTLFWNVHRVYGFVRYPMIMADFEILNIFRGNRTLDTGFEINWNFTTDHHTIVLRKKSHSECTPVANLAAIAEQ